MDCEHTLIEANTPCAYGYEYACVMGNGKATILEHTEEKRLALSKLMWHQTGKEFEISEQMADSCLLYTSCDAERTDLFRWRETTCV